MRILILKPSSLGDVVQALPVLRLLKRSFPDSKIYWWLDLNLLPLLEGDPDLSGIFPFDRQRWRELRCWRELLDSVRQIRALRFDWVIDLQGLARSAAMAWLADGGLTIGVDGREGANGFYDVVLSRPTFHTHAVDWYLTVLTHLGVPIHWDFDWLPKRPAVAANLDRKWRADSARWIAIQPGARWPNKRWPVEDFAELVKRMAATHKDHRFVILGGEGDRTLGAAIAATAGDCCLDLAGRTSLPEMVEWIRLSELMVTNDTGPMHVAAALGRKVVALFGPTEPRRTGPYRQADEVLKVSLPCQPCLKPRCSYEKPDECLRALPVDAAYERVQQQLRFEH